MLTILALERVGGRVDALYESERMFSPCPTRLATTRIATFWQPEQLTFAWNSVDLLALPRQPSARYLIGMAASSVCVEAAQRLRYEVFNLELNEGLAEAHLAGLDRDPFDSQMTHLVLLDRESRQVVGTYRLQTGRQARAGIGFYSEQEYDLRPLAPWFEDLAECGRACIAAEHRSLTAIMTLWQGVRAFAELHHQRWLFGCCSLTSQDPCDGWRAQRSIEFNGWMHPELKLAPHAACRCVPCLDAPVPGATASAAEGLRLPKLFNAYMRLGAKVISQPAIDREFGTIDFLVLMDLWSEDGEPDAQAAAVIPSLQGQSKR